jgi:hypothetical protein
MGLKAYLVHDGEPSELAVLVFANNAQEARKTGYGHDDVGHEGFIHVRANRRQVMDRLLDQSKTEPYVEYRQTLLRAAGFCFEGDSSCCVCGLYSFDGAFPVCSECDCCSECGHDENCPTLGVSS